ncbi:helix-turn-helix domain-containing protein [Nonomuraea phyllanthi]|uniref:Helix-turn-helix domain-containing protein n=1 Tax=Nonomuraea phyllanthi TaxID=2219224 RepID=A0A5C4WT30_9ACTN|nr:helix-turn-helix transcriptional regulator [Nonomuraea phyllanthi]KAB8196730.1 helix-turn-helix domain-containing protein [Nonomuraea phyllanthi]
MSTAHDRGDLAETPATEAGHSGPTALRILVGAQLRRLREARGISREDAGYAIRGSHSKISRLEGGRTSFKLRDVADLLTLYGVAGDAEREAVLALAKQANEPSWWHDYRDVVPDWFEDYLGLEQDAALIRAYEVQFVPGLLQTEDYARAVFTVGHKGDPAERIERRVEVRMRRQRILAPPMSGRLWAVLDEAALHHRVGSREVMRAQLEHLDRMAAQPHVTVQVVPFDSGWTSGGVGPVTILRFAQAGLHDVVYLEQLAGAHYLAKEGDVLPYQQLMDELGVYAAPATDTPAILRKAIDAL